MSEVVSADEVHQSLPELLRAVQEGKSYLVTSHGRPVARLVPVGDESFDREEAKKRLIERLRSQPTQNIGRWTRDELYD